MADSKYITINVSKQTGELLNTYAKERGMLRWCALDQLILQALRRETRKKARKDVKK